MREELEEESRSLEEQQCGLENTVISLEEKIIIEELKIEKAAIEDLKNRNKTAKEAISKLKSKKKKLETKLDNAGYDPEESPSKNQEEASEPEEKEEASEPEEKEEIGEGGVVVTAIDGEAFEEQVGISTDDSPKQEKRKRRFF